MRSQVGSAINSDAAVDFRHRSNFIRTIESQEPRYYPYAQFVCHLRGCSRLLPASYTNLIMHNMIG